MVPIKQIDIRNRIENPEIKPYVCNQTIFMSTSRLYNSENTFFSIHCIGTQISVFRRIILAFMVCHI